MFYERSGSGKACERKTDDPRVGEYGGSGQASGQMGFAIGNAPTALIRLHELILEKKVDPVLVIGVPVGFVNVVESKEEILKDPVPYIVARGRKGGSNVAAAICNALLYTAAGRTL